MILATMRVDRNRSGPARREGFSLLELLVSISVLGILVVLMLPSLSAVMRETAPLMRCTSNLHQIHQALTLYLEDSNDVMPLAGYDPLRDRSTPDLNETLSPYGVGDMEHWICPADPRPTIVQQNWGSEVYPVARLQKNNKVRIRAFDLGASYPMLADRGAFHGDRARAGMADPMNNSELNRGPRYEGTINQLGFLDGHNALLAQGTITHRAISAETEDNGGPNEPIRQGSWMRRLLGW